MLSTSTCITLILATLATIKAEDLADLPSFDTTTPTELTVYQGDMARLMCSVNNLQGKKVTWHKEGRAYPLTVSTFSFLSDGKYTIEHDEDSEWNLLIREAERDDTGIYICRVTTQSTTLTRIIHLTVQDKPPTSTPAVTMGNQSTLYVEKGKPLILQCNATAKKDQIAPDLRVVPPEVEWFKDGNKIDSHVLNKILITNRIQEHMRISTLTIDKTDMENAGIYVCRTTDKTNAEIAVRILNGKRKTSTTTLSAAVVTPGVEVQADPVYPHLATAYNNSDRIVNVDKDNKKRGTVSDIPAVLGQSGTDNSSIPTNFVCLTLIFATLALHLT